LKNLAPIVLFTYLRLDNLINTINFLKNNYFAPDSTLIIFSDGPKDINDNIKIEKVRNFLKTINGFKEIIIYESKFNKGLAKSIIEGVSLVFTKYDKIIVLEDDLITSINFLYFMNQALEYYEYIDDIYSISGYLPSINLNNKYYDTIILNRSWSWGWATWKNRWTNIDWELEDYNSFSKNLFLKRKFSKLGSDVNTMLKNQMNGYIDSWYIRFIYHQFKINGLTIYPTISKIINNGFDNYATHNIGNNSRFYTNIDNTNNLNFKFSTKILIDRKIQSKFNSNNGYFKRFFIKIKNLLNL